MFHAVHAVLEPHEISVQDKPLDIIIPGGLFTSIDILNYSAVIHVSTFLYDCMENLVIFSRPHAPSR